MKIAVVGGGIFGCTAAIKLARAGYEVELFEQYPDILQAASGINQYRLHRGYHYPRSPKTVQESRDSEPLFLAEYGQAVNKTNKHYYCLAKENSLVDRNHFLDLCRRCNLETKICQLEFVDHQHLQLVVKVREYLIDIVALRHLCWQKLNCLPIKVRLNTRVNKETITAYDLTVNCTYANLNFLLDPKNRSRRHYQFEVCEKPVVRLPSKFRKQSLVIIDGPFACLDPYADTDYHVMGNVIHAIHARNVGYYPKVPETLRSVLNRGLIENPPLSKFSWFINSVSHFIPKLNQAKHIGSMFTVRTVLPNLDKTDARPTMVEWAGDKIINVFSGKIGTSVAAARQIINLVNSKINSGKKSPQLNVGSCGGYFPHLSA